MPEAEGPVRIDAKTFQEPLASLVETMVQKVHREGTKHAGLPANVADDFSAMLRYSVSVYRLLYCRGPRTPHAREFLAVGRPRGQEFPPLQISRGRAGGIHLSWDGCRSVAFLS
jgi:hypothetical protein